MSGITWTPIEEMPDHLRDGRDVLLHYPLEGLSDDHSKVIIGGWNEKLGVWVWQNRAVRAYSECYQPNYFAEINVPGEVPCTCLTELEDDGYEPGGPMSGKPKPPPCQANVHTKPVRLTG